ncbi:MAG TPA: hypothetical protein VGS08_06235 [Candidatus Saccharimonadales bacterium]|nr:hypothetical protein [Candidatus Saccharimonadales bacterium]
MGICDGCVETVRNADSIYILNTHDRTKGPVDVMSVEEYGRRHAEALRTGDNAVIFSDSEVTSLFTDGEHSAHGDYLAAGCLAVEVLTEGRVVTAYEHRRDLPTVSIPAESGHLAVVAF